MILALFCSSCQRYKPKTVGGWINVKYDNAAQPVFIEFIDKDYVRFEYSANKSTVFKYKLKNHSLYLEDSIYFQAYKIYETIGTLLLINTFDTIHFKPIEFFYSTKVLSDLVLDKKSFYWNIKTERSPYSVNVQFLSTEKCIIEYSGLEIDRRSYQLGNWGLIRKTVNGNDYFILNIKSSSDNLIFLTNMAENKFDGVFLDSYPTLDKISFERVPSNHLNIIGEWSLIESDESNNHQTNIPRTLAFNEDVFSFDYEKPLNSGDYFRFGYYESFFSDSLIVLDHLVNNNYGDLIQIVYINNDTLKLGFFSSLSNVPIIAKYGTAGR